MEFEFVPDYEFIPDKSLNDESLKALTETGKEIAGFGGAVLGMAPRFAGMLGAGAGGALTGARRMAEGTGNFEDLVNESVRAGSVPFHQLATEPERKWYDRMSRYLLEPPREAFAKSTEKLGEIESVLRQLPEDKRMEVMNAWRFGGEAAFDVALAGVGIPKGLKGAFKRPKEAEITPEELEAARKAKEPPKPEPKGEPPLPKLEFEFLPDEVRPTEPLTFPAIEGQQAPLIKGAEPFKPAPEPTYREPLTTEANYRALQEPISGGVPQPLGEVRFRPQEPIMKESYPVDPSLQPIEPGLPREIAQNRFLPPQEGRPPIVKQGPPIDTRGGAFSDFERASGRNLITEPSIDPQFKAFVGEKAIELPPEPVRPAQNLGPEVQPRVSPQDPSYRAFVGDPSGGPWHKQRGAINLNTFSKEQPLEERIRIATRQLSEIKQSVEEIKNDIKNATDPFTKKTLEESLATAQTTEKYTQRTHDALQAKLKQPKAEPIGFLSRETRLKNKEWDLEQVRGEAEMFRRLGQWKEFQDRQPEIAKLTEEISSLKGPRSRQRGAIDPRIFDSEEFNRFKENLPENLRPKARALWKALEEEDKSKVDLNTSREAIAEIPGLKNALKYIEPELRSTEEVLASTKTGPDINLTSAGRGLTSGMQLTGVWKKNEMLHYVGQLINRAKVASNANIYNQLMHPKTGLKTAIDKVSDISRVWKTLMENEGKRDLTIEDLQSLSKQEIVVAQKFREVFDSLHDLMNQTRKEVLGPNTPDLHKRPGYIPGIFGGDFQGMVWRKHTSPEGKVTLEALSRYGADTKWEANRLRDIYREHFKDTGDIVVGAVEHRAVKPLELRDSNIVFNELAELISKDDPLFQMVEDLQQRLLQGKAYEYAGIRKHFEPKKREGILGARGFELGINPLKNAKNGFQASLRYAEKAFDWIELQKVGQEIKKILADEEFKSTHPNTYKYVDLYWKNVSGQGTAVKKAIDTFAKMGGELTGVGISNVRNATRTIKSFLTISYLTTLTFTGVQVLQPIQMGISWLSYLKGKGASGNPIYAFGMSMADILNIKRSNLGKVAIKWAEDKHILQSHILDDIRPQTLEKWLGGLRELAGKPLQKVEEFSRRASYLTWVHFLEDSGMKSGPQMFETASNLVNMVMTDYRLHERPIVYQQLGAIGEGLSTLTAFKHNNYTQLFTATQKGQRTNMLPAMIGTMAMFGGAMGLWFREDVDDLIHFINDHGPTMDKPLPTLQGFMIKEMPDWLAFGGMSKLTGEDLSSRFGSTKAFPEMGINALFPYTSDVVRRINTPLIFAGNPSKETALAAANVWSPNALKFITEEMSKPEDSKVSVSPTTGKGVVERNKFDIWSRRASGRSLRESKELIANREAKMFEQSLAGQRARLLDMAKHAPSRREELMAKYVKLAPDPVEAATHFRNELRSYEENKRKTEKMRLIEKGGIPAKRRLEYDQ